MSYVYPFAKAKATEGRIDQGQDFGGTGSILAIGRAKILQIGAPGWPGGNGVLYRLLDGRMKGRVIYVFEGIQPSVKAGQIVEAGEPIGSFIPGSSTGIEIGFANEQGVPTSHSEYTEGKVTFGGRAMARFLKGLKSSAGSGGGGGIVGEAKGTLDEAVELSLGGLAGAAAGLGGKAGDLVGGVVPSAGEIAGKTIEELAGLLGINASAIMLNIGLVGGGAFLVYYGLAKAAGVDEPVRQFYTRAQEGAELAAVAVPK